MVFNNNIPLLLEEIVHVSLSVVSTRSGRGQKSNRNDGEGKISRNIVLRKIVYTVARIEPMTAQCARHRGQLKLRGARITLLSK